MLSPGTPLRCSLLHAQKYTPVKEKPGSRKRGLHDVISFWDDLERTLCLWDKHEYVHSPWYTVPICAPIAKLRGAVPLLCRLKAPPAAQILRFQDMSPEERKSGYWKGNHISRFWLIPANFMLWLDTLSLLYLQLMSETVIGSISNDFGCPGDQIWESPLVFPISKCISKFFWLFLWRSLAQTFPAKAVLFLQAQWGFLCSWVEKGGVPKCLPKNSCLQI